MSKIRVSAVSYTNTLPFVYGLQHSGILEKIELSLDNPSDCAQKLIDDEADIGLVPVASLLDIPGYKIISDYCIGADGAVDSVFIFSNKPLQEVKTIRLDPQSRTSNALAKILVNEYWNFDIDFSIDGQTDAYVEIGDRTFGKRSQYPFVYDLAEEWKNFTGLPFAFAVWASNKPVETGFLDEFNRALEYGLQHRKNLIAELPQRSDVDLENYLLHRIDYDFTSQKRIALDQFLSHLKTIQYSNT